MYLNISTTNDYLDDRAEGLSITSGNSTFPSRIQACRRKLQQVPGTLVVIC